MTTQEIFNYLSKALSGAELMLEEVQPDAVIRVPREALLRVAETLSNDPELNFDYLMCISGVDKGTELQTVYHLYSMKHKHRVALRCAVSKDDPIVPSLCQVWPAANWHEREAWDMFGIRFNNHPDHRRILCADDWEGHPLRKDYKAPESFHGIPLTNLIPGAQS